MILGETRLRRRVSAILSAFVLGAVVILLASYYAWSSTRATGITVMRTRLRTLMYLVQSYRKSEGEYPPMVALSLTPLRTALDEYAEKLARTNGSDLYTVDIGAVGHALGPDSLPTKSRDHGIRPSAWHYTVFREYRYWSPVAYSRTSDHYILFSAGPDEVFDIDPERDFAGGARDSRNRALTPLTYDSTNETLSRGDIWHAE